MPERPPQPSSPQYAASRVQLALERSEAGRKHEAIEILRHLLAEMPSLLSARCLLGALFHEIGDSENSLIELTRASALAPSDVLAHEIRASVLLALNRAAEAEAAARTALSINPRRPRSLMSLGLALDAQGRREETIDAMNSALVLQPNSLLGRRVLVRQLLATADVTGARAAALHSSLLDDETHAQTVIADFSATGALEQAAELLQALIERYPQSYSSIILLARTLHQMGRSSEALIWSERAQGLRPYEIEPKEMRAVSWIDRGEVDAGLALYRELLDRPDVKAETASRYLILAHYNPAEDNDALYQMHVNWVQRFVRPFGEPFAAKSALVPDRPLRIGWLSPRFGEGPVASFLAGLLAAFDRKCHRHILVSLRASDDEATKQLRNLSDDWLTLHNLDDAELLTRLRAADFDIVIDLAGHSFGNRLRVLAQRVAPIQLCWLDYFDTTATRAIDGWISDAWLTPHDSPQRYVEQLLRLPSGRFSYSPSPRAPEPQRIGGGPPVFVSFNRLAKLNDNVLDVWAAILHRIPGSQLELGTGLLGDAIACARTLERFAQRGIVSERLRLHATRSYVDLLEAYRQTDIALDPFPFSGCTTTCDALWMGVPVLSLPGTTFVGRQSASLLWRLDRQVWVARDAGDYVERAVALADQVEELRTERSGLREQTRKVLCDAETQASEFAALLRNIWHAHCERKAANP